ncbi:hypothetical protein EMCRGX_G010402 [Ephydatia muelleri]
MSEGSEKEMSRSEKKDREKLLYQDVMKYIMERAYRVDAEKNWKRTIRRKAGEFVLEDGGGHFGRDKTLQKACSRFYWHDMTNDIKEHIRTCDTCQRTNKKLSKASAELHPIPVRSEVWHQVEIDLVGPLTLTRNNNRFLVTCTDYFSKWPEAQALPSKCAEGIANFIYSLIAREAVLPIQLHTSNVDNGHAIPEIESEAQRHAARLDMIRTETFMKVASNIENAQAKQKLYYDRKHAKAEFKLGSPVLLRNMRKLSRKGGKMDNEWTGPFTIAEVCDKALYLLKIENGKVLKNLYNSIQLKTYEERQIHEAASDLGQVHAGASDEEIASKIEQDFTASHNEESASKERLAIGVTDSHNEKIYGSEISTRELLHEQLFSPQLFRLWQTGANELAFNPAEDDDDFDTSGLNSEAGEYALNKDLIVEHWLTHRAYNKEAPLRDFCGGQFVIMNEKLSKEFDHFRMHDINGSFYPVESLQLLECWFKSSGISIKTIIRYGKRYFLLSAVNIDAFCQWVMETRKMYNKDGVVLDSLNLASKPDLNVCASGFIKLRPDNCTTNEAKVSVNDCDEEKQQSKKTSDEEKPIKKARKVRCRKQWMEVEDVKLYEEHRCILESNKWVDDVLD